MSKFGPPKGKETLIRYLMKYMPQFIVSSIAGIIYNTAIVLGPIFLGNLIDAAGGTSGRQVLISAFYFIGVTAAFQFARFVKRWFMRDQFNRMACDLRQTFMERTLGRKLPDLEKETVGDLMSRNVGDITLVVDTVMTTLNEGWDTWLLMISYFVTLMIMDYKITLIASIMVPITILLAQNMRHILYKYSMAARNAASASNSGLQRYLGGAAVLRLFGREASEAEGIENSFEEQAKFNIKEMLLQQALLPVYSLIAGFGVVIVIALGGQKVVRGDWTVGAFNAFLVMFVAYSGRTRVAARVFNRWHAAKAAWKRVQEKITIKSLSQKLDSELLRESGVMTLNVDQLSFSFDNHKVLNNISFTAKKGQIIGITGAVGSGKTSLALALTGLYSYEGSIKLDDEELSALPQATRTNSIAYTGHEQFLFSISVGENILFAREDKNDDKALIKALEAASLKEDIESFEEGLKTMVGEKGVKVSGGQRQRIAMARAIYSGADILLLDDPFSAVDLATEKNIIEKLKSDFKDKIVLLFTHRLSAFRHADQILILDKGCVVETGTHEELINIKGLYHEIYSAQAFMEVKGDE